MTNKDKTATQAEALVRHVLSKTFHQNVDKETLNAVTEKVLRAVPETKIDEGIKGATPKKVA